MKMTKKDIEGIIPHRDPFLLVDEIIEVEPGKTIKGIKYVNGKEYFLNYDQYPYFRDQTLKSIQNVKLLHGFHLHWPDLDVDLEIDNLENPGKYPLISKVSKRTTVKRRLKKAKH